MYNRNFPQEKGFERENEGKEKVKRGKKKKSHGIGDICMTNQVCCQSIFRAAQVSKKEKSNQLNGKISKSLEQALQQGRSYPSGQ